MVIFLCFFPLFVLKLSVNEFFKSPFHKLNYYIIAKLDSDTITGIILADVINSQHGLLKIRHSIFFTVDNHQKQDLSKLSRYHTVEKGHHARFFALWSNGALLSNVLSNSICSHETVIQQWTLMKVSLFLVCTLMSSGLWVVIFPRVSCANCSIIVSCYSREC